jgi:hypothetical protein
MGRSVLVERAPIATLRTLRGRCGLDGQELTGGRHDVAGRHCREASAGIAAQLNERGIPTSSGQETWQAVQVSRVLGEALISGF